MATTGSYKASEMHTNVEKEIERLRTQALVGWDKEFRYLEWFGLRDGVSVLEVGSGPGFVTAQLLDELPGIEITTLEIDPDLVSRAEQYLGSRAAGNYRIMQGDVMKMDLPDNSFDFAYARLVFQHLPDPGGALDEIRRVLKPGGVLAILDVDSSMAPVIEPTNAEADAVGARLTDSQSQHGGDRRIGRKLWRMLKAHGYENMDLELFAAHSDSTDIELMMPSEWDPGAYEPFVKAGRMTREDVEIMHRAHMEFVNSPDRYAMFYAVMVRGQKPLA